MGAGGRGGGGGGHASSKGHTYLPILQDQLWERVDILQLYQLTRGVLNKMMMEIWTTFCTGGLGACTTSSDVDVNL